MTSETIICATVCAVILAALAYRGFQAVRNSRVPDDFTGGFDESWHEGEDR